MTDKRPFERPYVPSPVGKLAGALLVRPSSTVDRLPPLHCEPSPISDRARAQHDILVRTLTDNGVRAVVLDSPTDAPTTTLVGDCAVVIGDGAILMRPSAIERRSEVAFIERALIDAGVTIVGRIEPPGVLDGGDVEFGAGKAWVGVVKTAGLARRSNEIGRQQFAELAKTAGVETVEVPLAAGPLRLRNVCSFVADDAAIVAPDVVDTSVLGSVTTIEVPRGEEYAAGVLVLRSRAVIVNLRFREAVPALRRAKVSVEAIDLWEFGKAGAGVFSLAVPLKRT